MTIDMFDTRRMLPLLEQMKPARMFLKELFFRTDRRFDTEYVDVDIMKGKRRMAPFVSPIVGGKVVERIGFTTNTFKPALVAPFMVTTAEDALHRSPGEGVYGAKSPDERLAEQLGMDLAELENMIARREEWMCAQALFTGAVTMTGDGVSQSVSFGLETTHNLTVAAGDKWTASTSDPIAQMRAWRRVILQDSGVQPDVLIMGTSAADALINNAKVLSQLDNRRVELGQITPQTLPNGVTYYGRIASVGIDLWGYDEWYLDDNGVEQPMVPVEKVLMASTMARTDLLYGAMVDVVRGTFAVPRFPKSWTQEQPSARFVQIQSRPLPVPTQIDAFLVADVI